MSLKSYFNFAEAYKIKFLQRPSQQDWGVNAIQLQIDNNFIFLITINW
jgi:hypothetical protein